MSWASTATSPSSGNFRPRSGVCTVDKTHPFPDVAMPDQTHFTIIFEVLNILRNLKVLLYIDQKPAKSFLPGKNF